MQRLALVGLILLGAVGAGASQPLETPERVAKPNAYSAVGWASWYGREFHGRRTADGETFDMGALTAAHRTMPLPCYARVTNLRNGRSMLVRVNDRGPFVGDRLIDVSARVANLLDFQRSGLTKVKVEYVGMAPLSGADGPALLASLSTRESSSDGVSAYAPTAAGVSAYAPAAAARNIFPAANALAATNRAATLPLRTASLDVDGPARMVSFDAPPLRDVSPPSPYGELAPSPYGDLAPWPADPAAPSSLMAEIRQ